jgi:hypothetical protein
MRAQITAQLHALERIEAMAELAVRANVVPSQVADIAVVEGVSMYRLQGEEDFEPLEGVDLTVLRSLISGDDDA